MVMKFYQLYGLSVSSTLTLQSPLPPTAITPQLHLTEQRGTRPLAAFDPLVVLPEEYWNVVAAQAIYRLDEVDVMRFADGDQIEIGADRLCYRYDGAEPPRTDLLDARLLGSGFAWWFLRQGSLPLHAGAVVVDGEAVLVVGESGMGKSSLLCSLVAQGWPLLSDDFVTVSLHEGQPVAASAYPQMRMWPETIERFIGSADPYPTVFVGGRKRRVPVGESWGRFLAGQYPVTRIYLLQREEATEGEVSLTPLGGHEAFMQLLAATLMASCFPTAGLHKVWPVLQQLADHATTYRLCYPSGWQWLFQVQAAILTPERPPIRRRSL
jgi:hypothetical protein